MSAPALIGKKIGMTRIYDAKGAIVPVTVVEAGPCPVIQIKTPEVDGYHAIQIAFGQVKPKNSKQADMGRCAKAGVAPHRYFREVPLKEKTDLTVGTALKVGVFEGIQFVDVIGTSKGKGFAGVMKRHHFGGQPASHGTERKHRSPGSNASYATWRGQCGKPKKGKRMAGHMGAERVTSRNHALVKIVGEKNLLLIKGAVPGANGSLVYVRKSITAKVKPAETK